MAASEGVTDGLKERSQWEWFRVMDGIVDCADRKLRRLLKGSPI